MAKPKVVAVVGPTASGKTSLSIEIAKKCNGEVISCDSRQVYEHLDVGTAKVTEEEMLDVPHHLLDMAKVTETYTAADFTRDASKAIEEITAREKLPIVAGGTFFYLDLLRGKGVGPEVPVNDDLRTELEKVPTEELFTRLKEVDPERAETIDPHNKRRLIRALEIIEALGKVPSLKDTDSPNEWLIIGLSVPKEILLERFRARAEHWLQSGIVEETKWLTEQVSSERFKEFGFEYAVTKEYIDGEITEDELRQKYVEKNWQYAKRQLTWLKRDREIEWFSLEERESILELVKTFLS